MRTLVGGLAAAAVAPSAASAPTAKQVEPWLSNSLITARRPEQWTHVGTYWLDTSVKPPVLRWVDTSGCIDVAIIEEPEIDPAPASFVHAPNAAEAGEFPTPVPDSAGDALPGAAGPSAARSPTRSGTVPPTAGARLADRRHLRESVNVRRGAGMAIGQEQDNEGGERATLAEDGAAFGDLTPGLDLHRNSHARRLHEEFRPCPHSKATDFSGPFLAQGRAT